MGARRQGRILAFQALFAWDYTRLPVEELLEFRWMEEMPEMSSDTVSFARLLVSGTIENVVAVDERIKLQLDHWDFGRISRVDMAILRLSAYSLLYVDSIPPSVAIDEGVSLAREFGSDDSYRFVNGVLDGIHRFLTEAKA